eukprot:SAG22_NODE_4773_length_1167_cov_0.808989_1_plen_234_part_01
MEGLMGMGFPEQWCKKALAVTGDDAEAAANYIMGHMDEPEAFWAEMPAAAPAPPPAATLTDGMPSDVAMPAAGQPGGAAGRGRGKDLTQPAWLKTGDLGPAVPPAAGASGDPAPAAAAAQAASSKEAAAPHGAGRGRGAGLLEPAWKTTGELGPAPAEVAAAVASHKRKQDAAAAVFADADGPAKAAKLPATDLPQPPSREEAIGAANSFLDGLDLPPAQPEAGAPAAAPALGR